MSAWRCPKCESTVMLIKPIVIYTPVAKNGADIDAFAILRGEIDDRLALTHRWRPTGEFIIQCEHKHQWRAQHGDEIRVDWSSALGTEFRSGNGMEVAG